MKARILKVITVVVLIIFMISLSAIDSDSWIPLISFCISLIWLIIIGFANGGFEEW